MENTERIKNSRMDERQPYFICVIVVATVFSGTGTIYATTTVIPREIVAVMNDSTFFNCSTTSEEVEWLFGSDQYLQPIIYSYGSIKPLYEGRFRVQKYANSFGNQFNLILLSVAKDDAGRYICRDPDILNEEGQEVHLIVLDTEPACESNLNVSELIGPNSCAIKPDTVQLSCSVRYSGNQFPEMQWTQADKNTVINSSTCSSAGNIRTCNLKMESKLQMERGAYVCQTTQSRVRKYNCTTGVFRIIYVFGEHTEIIGTVNDKVYCSVNSSIHTCTSSWIFDNGNTNWTASHERVVELERAGRYICEAICVLRNNNCTLSIKTVTVTVEEESQGADESSRGQIIGIVVAVAAADVIVISTISFAIYLWNKKKNATVSWLKQTQEQTTKTLMNHTKKQELHDKDSDATLSGLKQELERTMNEQLKIKIRKLHNEYSGSTVSELKQKLEQARNELTELHDENTDEMASEIKKKLEHSMKKQLLMNDLKELDDEYSGTVARDTVLRYIKPMVYKHLNRGIRGLTILNDELFLAFEKSNIIEAVLINFCTRCRTFVLAGLTAPGTIAACAKNNCLYVIDQNTKLRKRIFRVKTDGGIVNSWETDDDDRGRISVNRAGHVVMTVFDKRKVKIYSPDGELLTERTIDFSGTHITDPYHTINMADGYFIISHGLYKSDIHQVCKFDATGNILLAFGNKKGCRGEELDCPVYLAERKDGSILVADQDNDRVILLNSELEFVKELFTKKNCNVSLPEIMFVYEENEPALLFLGCNKLRNSGGYVLVLRLSQ